MNARLTRLTCLVLLATIAGTGCGIASDPDLASITRESEHITPELLLHRAQSRLEDPVRRTLESRSEWTTFLGESLAEQAASVEAGTDFASSFIAVAAMGRRPTGGFNISIPDAYVRRDSMFVLVRHTIPGKNCIVPQAQTSPLVAVSLPQVASEVRFVVEERTLSCE